MTSAAKLKRNLRATYTARRQKAERRKSRGKQIRRRKSDLRVRYKLRCLSTHEVLEKKSNIKRKNLNDAWRNARKL